MLFLLPGIVRIHPVARWLSRKATKLSMRAGMAVRSWNTAFPSLPQPFSMWLLFPSSLQPCALLFGRRWAVGLEAPIQEYLPEVPDFGHKITLNHLVHHTSGMRDQWELLVAAGWRWDDVITKDHIMKMVRRQRELNFEPGAEYLYCNTGYTLMAETVQRVSGKSLRGVRRRAHFPTLRHA